MLVLYAEAKRPLVKGASELDNLLRQDKALGFEVGCLNQEGKHVQLGSWLASRQCHVVSFFSKVGGLED